MENVSKKYDWLLVRQQFCFVFLRVALSWAGRKSIGIFDTKKTVKISLQEIFGVDTAAFICYIRYIKYYLIYFLYRIEEGKNEAVISDRQCAYRSVVAMAKGGRGVCGDHDVFGGGRFL